jgi:lysozyme family protein
MKEEISEVLRDKLFDTAVNTGHGNAVKILQRALNCLLPPHDELTVDGALGSKTLAAIASVPLKNLLSRYVAYNLSYYEKWLKGNGRQFYPQREQFYARARWLPPEAANL